MINLLCSLDKELEKKIIMGKASIERPWMKYYQEFDGDLSTTKQSLYRYLRMTSKGYGDYVAFNYFGKKYTSLGRRRPEESHLGHSRESFRARFHL